MNSLHVNVYASPTTGVEGPAVGLRGADYATLRGESGGPPAFLATMPATFEAMQAALLELPRSDCEPDGFFLITGREDGVFWRLNGHMHEFEGSMHRVELNGECPVETLDAVLRTMGWPEAELAFELVKEGVTLREQDFRRWAATLPAGATHPEGASRVVPTAATPPERPPVEKSPPPPAAVGDDAARAYTTWHITFGTYGARLHGDARPTVDRDHNEFGEPFVSRNDLRRESNEVKQKGLTVRLSPAQREFIERTLPAICERGGWRFRAAAAQPDHIHVVCEVRSDVHGEKVRRLMKRWLTEALDAEWPDEGRPRWWAVQGSNKAITDEAYRRNAIAHVERQRTLR